MTQNELDIIEKWKTLSALSGINLNDLYDSDDDNAGLVFECLEKIEEHEAMIQENELPFRVAQHARTLGLTTDSIWEYHNYQSMLQEQAEQERLAEEERNNPRIKTLREKYKLEITEGDSPHQVYWKFEADLGDGLREYQCRYVQTSWYNKRIWREWKDSAGKKQREKYEFGGTISNTFIMDKHWPAKWQQNYGRNFSSSQIPYAYTQQVISQARVNKSIKNKKVKAV